MQRPFEFHRRSFLRGAGLTLAGLGMTSLFPSPLMRHAMAGTTDAGGKRLLFIFLRGGNDGINTLIPHGDADYSVTTRPTLYISPGAAIDLNGFASLNPGLADLQAMWNAGDLAAVHRVGYPNMSRSHFDGQRIWENGDPNRSFLFEGWLYRFLEQHPDVRSGDFPVVASPFAGTLASGSQTFKVDVSNPDNFSYGSFAGQPIQDKLRTGWRAQYDDVSRFGRFREALSGTEIKLQDFVDEYASWDQANWNPTDPNTGHYLFPIDEATNPDDPSGPGGKKFAPSYYPFFKSLKVTALALLESDGVSPNGTRVAGTQLGSFDTHEGQAAAAGGTGFHQDLLAVLGYGMNSLYVALSGAATNEPRGYASIWADTVITTMSEFGRTTFENGSIGTDHGNATCVLMGGGSINGGVYNCDPVSWPAGVMFGNEGRDLAEETDYRALFWELLRDHMGANPSTVDQVFPGYSGLGLSELGVF